MDEQHRNQEEDDIEDLTLENRFSVLDSEEGDPHLMANGGASDQPIPPSDTGHVADMKASQNYGKQGIDSPAMGVDTRNASILTEVISTSMLKSQYK